MDDFRIEEIRKQLEDITLKSQKKDSTPSKKEFSSIFKDALVKINQDQQVKQQAMKDYISGKNTNLHETLLSLEKADISFKLMMKVRSKLVSAYKEIMGTQV